MGKLSAVIVTSALLAACGGGGSQLSDEERTAVSQLAQVAKESKSAKACTEMFAEGAVIVLDDLDKPCKDAAGKLHLYGYANHDCVDGGTLGWNDVAWWDETMVAHAIDQTLDTKTAPDDLIAACQG
jgi:hypothetical protein